MIDVADRTVPAPHRRAVYPTANAQPGKTAVASIGADSVVVVINVDAGGLSGQRRRKIVDAVREALASKALRFLYADGATLPDTLRAAAALQPRAILVCGGDGTARTAIEILTPLGIPTAPLPGGTLNRLTHAVYGHADLRRILAGLRGASPAWIPAGAVGGRRFYVVSGYGAPMRLNLVREHVRAGRLAAAWRAFTDVAKGMFANPIEVGRLGRREACAIIALGPVDAAFGLRPASDRSAFEVATAGLKGWGQALLLAPLVLLGGWRTQPSIRVGAARTVALKGGGAGLPALLDGEPVLLPNEVVISYEERAGLVWR